MAQNITITCEAGKWTLIASNDIDAIRVQNLSGGVCHLQATQGTVEPEGRDGAMVLPKGAILVADLPLDAIFPGVDGANRIWAMPVGTVVLSVSHR